MSAITSIPLPEPIDWSTKKKAADRHVNKVLETLLADPIIEQLYIGALAEVCSESMMPSRTANAAYWYPYLAAERTLSQFFSDWLTYTPTPADPGLYIEYWDYLVNTPSGLQLENNHAFKLWFRQFLNYHGDWINSTSSITTLHAWIQYKGTPDHPFDINDYQLPEPDNKKTGGFKSFNQFFLRNLKKNQRPLCPASANAAIVAPCDGGIFYLNRDEENASPREKRYALPGKSDNFNLLEALPGYGPYFLDGPLLDILLWFTDYHHFHAPVSGTVIHQGLYRGSYNYDFGDYNPDDFYAPALPADSDRVGWYDDLGKHQRYVWIIRTENLGLVAMIAIGFWGVGSIVNALENGQTIEQGQYMGHFGYGGSSIVLAFHRDLNVDFKVGYQPVQGPDNPVLMKVRQCLG